MAYRFVGSAIILALLIPAVVSAGQTVGPSSSGINSITATGSGGMNPSWPGSGYVYTPSRSSDGTGRSIPARPDQVRVGYNVWSNEGPIIGHVAYADGRVAVVQSAGSSLRIPVDSFRVKQNGLVLGLTPAKFEVLAGQYGARRLGGAR
jgi:hypothetical protein